MDVREETKAKEECRTEAQEQEFAKTLVGMTVTGTSFSIEDGYMIEFNHMIRFRSCCPHSAVYKRRVQ
jgi:hypothetical protein